MIVHLATDPIEHKPRAMGLARVGGASLRLDTGKAGAS